MGGGGGGMPEEEAREGKLKRGGREREGRDCMQHDTDSGQVTALALTPSLP